MLRVISESPTDVEPVFEAIMDAGMRLFQSQLMAIFRYDGRLIHFAAHRNWPAEALAQVRTLYPMPVDENTLAGRVILGGKAIAVEDTQAEQHYTPAVLAKTGGWRRMIIAPMLKDGQPVGTVHVAWRDAGRHAAAPDRAAADLRRPGGDRHRERAAVPRDAGGAGTSRPPRADILRVISSSPTDVQPVFDAIVDSGRGCAELHARDAAAHRRRELPAGRDGERPTARA